MDGTGVKTIKAAFWYIASSFISKAIIYILTPVLARVLSTYEYGQYNNFISWQNILVVLFAFELSSSLTIAFIDYRKNGEFDDYVNSIIVASYIIPLVFSVATWTLSDYFCEWLSLTQSQLGILLLYLCLSNTINIFQIEQRVKIQYKESAIVSIVAALLCLGVSLILLLVLEDKLIAALIGSTSANIIASSYLAVRKLKNKWNFKFSYLKYALIFSLPLVPQVLSSVILGTSDKVMITKFCGQEYTALYSLPYILSMVMTMIASSINKAWVPWYFNKLEENDTKLVGKISNYVVLLMGMCALGLCLIAPEILKLIGGKGYESSSLIMPSIMLACVINCIATFYINTEYYLKNTVVISIITVLAALVNLGMNYICILNYGYQSAAYTTLFSSLLAMLLHILYCKRKNMSYMFNVKWHLIFVVVLLLLCEGTKLLYESIIIRYVVLVVYVFIIILIMVIKRNLIKSLVSTIFKRR